MSTSEYGFDDWIKEVRHASLLNDCIEYPLRPGLDKLAETDKTAKMLRDRSIAKLMGTLPQPDYTLFTWSKAIFDHFDFLIRWIENYTLGVGIVNDWDLDETIKEMQKRVLEKGVDETFARNVLNPSKSFWKESEEYYQKEREKERAKAEKREQELKSKADAEKRESAKKLLAMGLSVDQISKALGLSLDEINDIKKKVQ